MSNNDSPHVVDQNSTPNPLVQQLARLVGTWEVEITMPAEQAKISGQTTMRWLSGDYFLEIRSTVARPEFPRTHTLIGGDDTFGNYTAIYYDSRGVARLYQMSLVDNVWTMWRDAPEFPQRFVGTFRDHDSMIDARWEKKISDNEWEVDFAVTYTKIE